MFFFLIVTKRLRRTYRECMWNNKGHGLRVKPQTFITLIYSVLVLNLSSRVGIRSTVILIAAIKDPSNLQSRHVVRVLKGIPPLSLVALDAIQIAGWINLAAGHVYVESKLGWGLAVYGTFMCLQRRWRQGERGRARCVCAADGFLSTSTDVLDPPLTLSRGLFSRLSYLITVNY